MGIGTGIVNSIQAYGLDGCNMKSETWDGIVEVPKTIVLFPGDGESSVKFPCIVGVVWQKLDTTMPCIALGYSEDKSKIRCDVSRNKKHSFLQKNDDISYYPFGCVIYFDLQTKRICSSTKKNQGSLVSIGLCIGSQMSSLDGEPAVEISFTLYNPYI